MKAVRAVIILSILCIVCSVVYLPAQMKSGDVVVRTAMLMGSISEIKVSLAGGISRGDAEQAIEKAFEEIRRIERVFSLYLPDSELSRINRLKKDEALKVSRETADLIGKAIGFCAATNGAFDITVKPLVDLWAEAKRTGKVPGDGEIRAAIDKTGCQNIILDEVAGTVAFSKDGMAIDMNAIVEGYAVDRAVSVLKANGVKSAIVNCGGDMYCLGRRSPQEQWKVGVRDPRNKENIALELRLEDKAVDTSGDYEKYFIIKGKRYSHIIDPRSGYSIGDNIASASVIAEDSVTADVFATALCVLGRERLNALDCIIFVFENGKLKVEMSDRVKERYHVTEIR
jgi:thiamine biosynthesis lipoprotein